MNTDNFAYIPLADDNGELEGDEQTVYACGGSRLILKCGENNTKQGNEENGNLNKVKCW